MTPGRWCVQLLLLGVLGGCDDMGVQPKQTNYFPLAPASVPADVVQFEQGAEHPPPVTSALLERGQERYRIFCTPCHSELGDGQGMIVQRGFPAPPSFHGERLRSASPQYLVEVIADGHGVMYGFADRIPAQDRWAIVAYIRALQRSRNAQAANLPAAVREALP